MELISVIVPVYGAEQYLDRCIESIVRQTYRNLEIILVDDGSPDKSPAICDKWSYKDSRIKVIHQKNQGVSVARNRGISEVKAKYFVQIDSDDYISENMIEHLYKKMIIDNSDLVICDFEKGSEEMYKFKHILSNDDEIITYEEALKRIYNNQHDVLRYVVPWAKLYKKELFEGLKYPEGKIFEDIYLTHHVVARCNKISILNEKLIYYYQNPTSIMNREYHIGKLDYLDALLDRIEFFKQNHLEELEKIAYEEYVHSLIWEYSRVRDILKDKNMLKNIKQRFRKAYKRGYISKRYINENRVFLYLFDVNPEIIIWYWRIKAKILRR